MGSATGWVDDGDGLRWSERQPAHARCSRVADHADRATGTRDSHRAAANAGGRPRIQFQREARRVCAAKSVVATTDAERIRSRRATAELFRQWRTSIDPFGSGDGVHRAASRTIHGRGAGANGLTRMRSEVHRRSARRLDGGVLSIQVAGLEPALRGLDDAGNRGQAARRTARAAAASTARPSRRSSDAVLALRAIGGLPKPGEHTWMGGCWRRPENSVTSPSGSRTILVIDFFGLSHRYC